MAMSMFGRGIATKGSGAALKVLQKATEQNVAFKVIWNSNTYISEKPFIFFAFGIRIASPLIKLYFRDLYLEVKVHMQLLT